MDGPNMSDCKKNDGPEATRTPDLRRVKAEDLDVSETFSLGKITVRKVNDPLYTV